MSTEAAAIAMWIGAFALSWLLTSRVRAYAIARDIFDHPNARSSHAIPTPRGGGLAIVIVAELSFVVLRAAGALEDRVFWALVLGSAAIALVGWLDDRKGLSSRIRFSVHLLVGLATVVWLGGLRTVAFGPYRFTLGPAGLVLGTLFIVWLLNLWNFMDGIDGIAAGEGLVAGLAIGMLLWPLSPGLALAALATSAACAGFLVMNWQPARIFMGDVGSATLGYVFATLALAGERTGALPFVTSCLILGVFIFDATLTLTRRALAGEKWHQAHRVHAYQRAVQSGWSHRRVSGAAMAFTAVLSLLAYVTVRWPSVTLATLAGATLAVCAVYLGIERRNPYRPPPR